MPLVLDDPMRVGGFVWPRVHVEHPGDFTAVGVENQAGDLVAGMCFNNWCRGFNVEIHLAIEDPKCVRLHFYKYCWQYAFIWLDVRRVTAICPEGNRRNERLVTGMGFTKEGVARLGYRKLDGSLQDAGLYSCLRTECKYIPKEYRTMKEIH